jgi:hypothetical protein
MLAFSEPPALAQASQPLPRSNAIYCSYRFRGAQYPLSSPGHGGVSAQANTNETDCVGRQFQLVMCSLYSNQKGSRLLASKFRCWRAVSRSTYQDKPMRSRTDRNAPRSGYDEELGQSTAVLVQSSTHGPCKPQSRHRAMLTLKCCLRHDSVRADNQDRSHHSQVTVLKVGK